MKTIRNYHLPANKFWKIKAILLVAFVSRCNLAGEQQPVEFIQPTAESTEIGAGVVDAEASSSTPAESAVIVLPTTTSPFQVVVPNPFDGSVLDQSQKDRLYATSLTFIADSEDDGIQVANSLAFISKNGHPSNMCGPLAMGILRDAGLTDDYIDLDAFWLLNPRDSVDARLLEVTFPKDKYLWYRTTTPLDQFDFIEFPLNTGDFMYIYAGDPGTFEHILVVTKVDDQGRAYTTTNIRREDPDGDGYIYLIEELMLYDPANPGEGIFYYWTDRANLELGITGFGGFQLWRPLSQIAEKTVRQLRLEKALDEVFNQYGGRWNVMIKEVGGQKIYARRAQERIHTASVGKVPLAMMFFHVLELREIEITDEFLNVSGTGGRTYAQLLDAMLVDSEEDATQILEDWVNEWVHPPEVFASWGFPETRLTPRQSTVQEIADLFEGLYTGEFIGPEGQAIILGYLQEYTPNDETRLGVLTDLMPVGSNLFNKRGTLVKNRVIVADVAIIEFEGKAYVMAFFAVPDNSGGITFEDLDAAIAISAKAFWLVYGE